MNIWPWSTIRFLRKELDDLRWKNYTLEKRLEEAQRNEPVVGRDGKFVDKNGFRTVRDPETKKKRKVFIGFAKDNSGVTIIEYGLIASLLVVGLVVVLSDVGTNLNEVFNTISTAV